MRAQRILKSSCASAKFNYSLQCPYEEILYSLANQNVPKEDSDQTARMRRLIWIFAGRTRLKVRFPTLRLILLQFVYFLHAFVLDIFNK